MPKRDATESSGMMWLVKKTGRPGISTLHICVDITLRPSARATFSGQSVGRLFLTGVLSMMKICVAPESAIATCIDDGIFLSAKAITSGGEMVSRVDTFDTTTVSMSSSGSTTVSIHIWVGYDESVT